MSHFQEIWKWDDAAKRLEEAREYRSKELSPAEVIANLESELRILNRLHEAKSIECARLQKRVEELEGR